MKKNNFKFILFLVLIFFPCLVLADVIDGNTGTELYPRNLRHFSIVVGSDLHQTTSIINHSLIGLSGTSRLMTYTSSSKLYLRNTSLALDGNYTFSHGSLEISGDVKITGSGHTFTFAAASLLINANSSLIIDAGVMFEFATSNSISGFPIFADKSSQIVLRDATLLVNNNSYGLQLTNGTLVIDGNSRIDNRSTAWATGFFLGSGNQKELDTVLKFTPGAQLDVARAGVVYRNLSSGSFNCNHGSLRIASDSSFIFEPIVNTGSSNFIYDGSILQSQVIKGQLLQVTPPVSYLTDQAFHRSAISPDGSLVLQALQNNSSQFVYQLYRTQQNDVAYSNYPDGVGTAYVTHVSWSPDGNYFAYGLSTNVPEGLSILNVKRVVSPFNLVSVTTDFLMGNTGIITGLAFSPDSKYLACCSTDYGSSITKNGLKVLKLNAYTNKFSLVPDATQTDISPNTGSPSGITWTPDGKYIVVTGGVTASGSYNIQAFKFDGLTTTRVATTSPMGIGGFFDRGSWAPNGTLFAVGSSGGGTNSQYNNKLFIYRFDGTSFTLIASYAHDAHIQAVKWSPDGKYVAFVSVLVSEPNLKIFSYSDDHGLQLIGNATGGFPVSANDLSWSPDGNIIYVASASGDINNVIPTFSSVTVGYGNRPRFMSFQNADIKFKQDTRLSSINVRLG